MNEVWPKVRKRAHFWLQAVDGGEKQLLAEIANGTSQCWRNSEVVVILSMVPGPDSTLLLFIRAGVSFQATDGAFDRVMPAIEQIARDLGCASIRFRSQRRGWERTLGPGWEVKHVEWSYDL
jgi:hypothetical protein